MTDVNLGLFKPDKSLLHLNRGEVLHIEPLLGLNIRLPNFEFAAFSWNDIGMIYFLVLITIR